MPHHNPTTIDRWWADMQRADTIEWVRISAETGEWVRGLTGCDDLLAEVSPGNSAGHPAIYRPEHASIEINPDICAPGEDPALISMKDPQGRLKHPALAGAACHEGSHRAFTRWKIDHAPGNRAVMEAALLLEEAAAEGDCIHEHPSTRTLLRASFDRIVADGLTSINGIGHAAKLAALIHGRVDAGILTTDEMAPVIELLRNTIGDRYNTLRDVWLAVQGLPGRDSTDEMAALGQRWLDILGDDAETPTDGDITVIICGDPTSGGPADGDITDGARAIRDAAAAVSAAAAQEAAQDRDKDATRTAARELIAEAKRRNKEHETAEHVFGAVTVHGHGAGDEGLSRERPPTPYEMNQARELGKRIEAAQFRERTTTRVPSQSPPGRLRSSEAVRRSAERSHGMMATAEPWDRTVRKHADSPPISAAIACDISGSMEPVVRSVASAAWVIARAIHHNEGTSTTIAYGERVHPVVRPGETPGMVREFNAKGGWENWTAAMDTINGSILRGTEGVRLAVFISDGHYRPQQREKGSATIARMIGDGVKVLWIGLSGARSDRPPAGCTYVHLEDPAELATTVGRTIVELLEEA